MPRDEFQAMQDATAHLASCAVPGCTAAMRLRYGPLCVEHAVLIADAIAEDKSRRVGQAQMKAVERRGAEKARAEAATRSRGRQPGWVYYVRIGDRVKIGYSADVKRRMADYPPGHRLLAVHPGTRELETEMHRRFAGSRDAGREWFRETPDLAEHIAQVLAQFGDPREHRHTMRRDRPQMRYARPA